MMTTIMIMQTDLQLTDYRHRPMYSLHVRGPGPITNFLSFFLFYVYSRLIIEKEGPAALFKGLGPNLVGVAPSRAIYFCSYSQSKKTYNQMFPNESPIVHICSAATAGKIQLSDTTYITPSLLVPPLVFT